jgi:hypothetical protein
MKYQIVHRPWLDIADRCANTYIVEAHMPGATTWAAVGDFKTAEDAHRFIELHVAGQKVISEFDSSPRTKESTDV